MQTIVLSGLDIDVLLSFLIQNYSKIINKIWRYDTYIHAIFIHEELVKRTLSNQTITVIVDYSSDTNSCEAIVVSSGGGSGLFQINLGSKEAAEKTFNKRIKELADKHGWQMSVKTVIAVYYGIKCPYCGAVYSYPDEKVHTDGAVECQSCAKIFKPSEPPKDLDRYSPRARYRI